MSSFCILFYASIRLYRVLVAVIAVVNSANPSKNGIANHSHFDKSNGTGCSGGSRLLQPHMTCGKPKNKIYGFFVVRSSCLVFFCLRFALMHRDTLVSHAQAHTFTYSQTCKALLLLCMSACRLKQRTTKQNNKIKAKFIGARARARCVCRVLWLSLFHSHTHFCRFRFGFVVGFLCAAIRSQTKVDSKSRFKTKQSESTLEHQQRRNIK